MTYCVVFYFFFFSSRRRHTRFDCDWSSDVCSSDLSQSGRQARHAVATEGGHRLSGPGIQGEEAAVGVEEDTLPVAVAPEGDRKSVVVGKECRSRWSPYH